MRASPRAPLRMIIAGVLGLAILAGGLALWRHRSGEPLPRPASATAAPRRSVAVLGFKDLTPRSDTEWIATAVTEALASGLAAGGRLRVTPGEEVARVRVELGLSDVAAVPLATLRQAGQNLGADFIALGSYDLASGAADAPMRLRLQLVETATGRVVAESDETGSTLALVDLVSRGETKIRQALGIAALPAKDAGAARALPANPEAARLYAEGLARLRLFDALSARDRLERAAALAPADPLVHVALAEVWSMMGYDSRAKAEIRQAFEHSGDRPLAERLAIEARHREVIGERDKAVEIWRTLWSFFPDDIDYGLQLAAAQNAAGRRQDSVATMDALRRLPRPLSDDPRIDLEEARAASGLGDYPRAQAAAARAAEKGAARGASLVVARARLAEAFALRATGEPARALAAAEDARRLFEAAGDVYGMSRATLEMAGTLRYHGRLDESRRMAEGALALSRRIGDTGGTARALNRVASVLAEQGRLGEARRMYEETLVLWREVDDPSGEGTALNNVGETLAKEGQPGAARRQLEEALALFRRVGSRRGIAFSLFNLGFVLYEQGDLAGARLAFEESLRTSEAIGEKSLAAVALYGIGGILAAEGDLGSAARAHGEAMQARLALGERGRAAESRLALASVDLEAGRTTDAGARVREAAKEFHAERVESGELLAQALLVLVLVAEGRAQEAVDTARRAAAAAERSEYRPAGLRLALARARAEAAVGRGPEALRLAGAVHGEAVRRGLVALAFEAQLARGEIEMRAGNTVAARARLEELARDAQARGFALIARKAAAAISSANRP